MEKTAVISECGKYRYLLGREWDLNVRKFCLFIMLNPSTANADIDDPTIRRCIGFAKRLNCGSLAVVNLFAYRATESADLSKVIDPVGPENQKYIVGAANYVSEHGVIIAAWSAGPNGDKKKFLAQEQQIISWLSEYNVRCLGVTKYKHPRHPLYLKTDSELIEFHFQKQNPNRRD